MISRQATCHFIQEELIEDRPIKVTRIGFGLPSGGGVTYADSVTLRSALKNRRTRIVSMIQFSILGIPVRVEPFLDHDGLYRRWSPCCQFN